MLPLLILYSLFVPIVVDVGAVMARGRRFTHWGMQIFVDIMVVFIYPFLYLGAFDDAVDLECCGGGMIFSPAHRLTAYAWIGLCAAAYLYSRLRKTLGPPVIELVSNCLLLLGIGLNGALILHESELFLWIVNVFIIVLFVLALYDNYRISLRTYLERIESDTLSEQERRALPLMLLVGVERIPFVFACCFPVFALVTLVLILLGQRHDAIVLAFTETYGRGLSGLTRDCSAYCGGHYLCSVAAHGHPQIVRPQRVGTRGGGLIVCNRQLLIANAFEELLEEYTPRLHRRIRRRYDRVGDLLHRNYTIYEVRWYADLIYLLMKPAEWVFLLVLYTVSRRPEVRIRRQYLPSDGVQPLSAGNDKIGD